MRGVSKSCAQSMCQHIFKYIYLVEIDAMLGKVETQKIIIVVQKYYLFHEEGAFWHREDILPYYFSYIA